MSYTCLWAIQKLLERTFSSLSQGAGLKESGKTGSCWLPGLGMSPTPPPLLLLRWELVQDIFITIVLGFSQNEWFSGKFPPYETYCVVGFSCDFGALLLGQHREIHSLLGKRNKMFFTWEECSCKLKMPSQNYSTSPSLPPLEQQ